MVEVSPGSISLNSTSNFLCLRCPGFLYYGSKNRHGVSDMRLVAQKAQADPCSHAGGAQNVGKKKASDKKEQQPPKSGTGGFRGFKGLMSQN